MPFAPGADVVVLSLRKQGRVVEIDARGRYRVVVGGMSSWCRETDLASVSQSKKQARREREAASGPAVRAGRAQAPALTPAAARALERLDLHGLTVPEAIQALEERLDKAIRAGLGRVEVIHGISGGRLRAVVRGYLAGTPGIARFEADARNPGVTWVYF
jgi:dsDNA-specific endonuclease/ATPase MutS2